MIYDRKTICGACLAADLLGRPAPHRRSGFVKQVIGGITGRLAVGQPALTPASVQREIEESL
jgi:hypothetical protein